LRDSYALVGVTERMEETLALLVRKLPSWFGDEAGGGDADAGADDADGDGDVVAAAAAAVRARVNEARAGARAEAVRQLTPVRCAHAYVRACVHALHEDVRERAEHANAHLSRRLNAHPARSTLRQAIVTALRQLNGYDWRLYVMARGLMERHVAACDAEEAEARAAKAVTAAAGRRGA
jgi:hypothetical protein